MTGLEFDLLSQEVGWWEGQMDHVRATGRFRLENGRWSHDGGMGWLSRNPDRRVEFDAARKDFADKLAFSNLDIARNTQMGVETTTKANGDVETKQGDMLGHRKLNIDTNWKMAARLDPDRYGERVERGGGGSIQVYIDKSCGGAVRIGLKDGAGNTSALEVGGGVSGTVLDSGTEPRFSGQEKDHA